MSIQTQRTHTCNLFCRVNVTGRSMSCHTNDEEEEGLESMLFSTLFGERNYKIVFSIAIELH